MGAKKCILFVRVSTSEQATDKQESELKKMALNAGYADDQIKSVVYHESGYKTDISTRQSIQETKELINTGEYDCIFAREITRIARKPNVLFEFLDFLVDRKVQLRIMVPEWHLLTAEGKRDQAQWVALGFYATYADSEMMVKKERFREGKRRSAENMKYNGGKIAFGYKIEISEGNKGRRIIVDEEKGPIVRKIYELYEKGVSQSKMSDTLVEMGFPRIRTSTIHHIMRNPAYTGEISEEKEKIDKRWVDGERIEQKYHLLPRRYPALITKEQFERCREIARNSNTAKSKSRNIYYGRNLIICPSCGGRWTSNGSRAAYHCYRAHIPLRVWNAGNYYGEKCTNMQQIPINQMDSLLWSIARYEEWRELEDIRVHGIQEKEDAYKLQISNATERLGNIDYRVHEQEDKKKRIHFAYINGGLPEDLFLQQLAEVDDNISKIISQKQEYERDIAYAERELKSLREMMQYVLSVGALSSAIENPVIKHELGVRMEDWIDEDKYIAFKEGEFKLLDEYDDQKRNDLVHKHIEKVTVSNFSFKFDFKRVGEQIANGKLIKVYTHADKRIATSDNPEEGTYSYPQLYLMIPFDGKGGRTIYQCLQTQNEITQGEVEVDANMLKFAKKAIFPDDQLLYFTRQSKPNSAENYLCFAKREYQFLDRFHDPRKLLMKKERARKREEKMRLEE